MTPLELKLRAVADIAIQDIKMQKDPELVILQAVLDVTEIVSEHFSPGFLEEPNPTRKEVK